MKTTYILACKNNDCLKPIALPLPIRHDKSPSQSLWPTDGRPRNFLCRDCYHVYEYTAQDVLESHDDVQAQVEGDVDDTVFRIEARCDEGNCGLPVYILLTAPSWQLTIAVRSDWFDEKKYVSARCTAGHLTASILEGSVDVHKDPDWK